MNSGKIVLGVMAGVAIGALLGVLLAPDKGSVTRKNFLEKNSKKIEGYADELKKKFNEYIESLAQKFTTSEAGAENSVKKGKTARAEYSVQL